MKKVWKWILGILGGVVILFIVARLTGWLVFYTPPTSSMEPSIKKGHRIFVTNLKKPKRNDIIVFSRTVTEKDGFDTPGKTFTFCYRLIGFGGEEIQIKNGLAYIDGKLVDNKDNLMFDYKVSNKEVPLLTETLHIETNNESDYGMGRVRPITADSSIVDLSGLDLSRLENKVHVERLDPGQSSNYIDMFGNDSLKRWTGINYGPVKIPENTYFVLGDNRERAADSRYVGPIPVKNLKGVVFSY